ncbi:MAG: DUF4430 domain-containing protein, partial [Clostridia bacterium]|nr:DUF4430 domain-containing protein [Clostridia bacterium]
ETPAEDKKTEEAYAEAKKPEESEKEEPPTDEAEPEEKPSSEEIPEEPITNTCTISITCREILDNMEKLDSSKSFSIPDDGIILGITEIEFEGKASAFDILQKAVKENGIHMEFSKTPGTNSVYIEGIANIYEFDCGELSGWMYKVNGVFPNYGCSQYLLQDGDVIEWVYTCDLGKDVGGDYSARNGMKNEDE